VTIFEEVVMYDLDESVMMGESFFRLKVVWYFMFVEWVVWGKVVRGELLCLVHGVWELGPGCKDFVDFFEY